MTQAEAATDWTNLEFKTLDHGCETKKFECGRQEIDDWFRKKAKKHQNNLRCRVQTAHLPSNPVPAGFFALQLGFDEAGKLDNEQRDKVGRDMFPAIDLLYIGIQRPLQRKGMGKFTLGRIIETCHEISKMVPFYALTLTAIDRDIVPFYEKLGFRIYDKEETERPRMLLPAQSIIDLYG